MINKLMTKYLNKKGFAVIPCGKPLVKLHKLDIKQLDEEGVIQLNAYDNNITLIEITDSHFHSFDFEINNEIVPSSKAFTDYKLKP